MTIEDLNNMIIDKIESDIRSKINNPEFPAKIIIEETDKMLSDKTSDQIKRYRENLVAAAADLKFTIKRVDEILCR